MPTSGAPVWGPHRPVEVVEPGSTSVLLGARIRPMADPSPESASTTSAEAVAFDGHARTGLLGLAIGAVGVVYGDIGTSPLYTMRECLLAIGGSTARADVLGICSTVFWAMTMVVTVKYLMFILRADNHGEGGILALLALVPTDSEVAAKRSWVGPLALLVIVGAGLLYGDGVITPAISVLGALEGVAIQRPDAAPLIVPVACVILLGLFAVQKRGTGTIGAAFGPIMIVWFFALAAIGTANIVLEPSVLEALMPTHAVDLLTRHTSHASALLAAVVLAVTGGEALYADMGHFGARPIRAAWLCIAMPALTLAYLGQGALLLRDPSASVNPFYHMVPAGLPTYALVVLSTFAAIIASQALISGVFSLTQQAVQLGFFPRVTILHTSKETEGQIYVPEINFALAVGCIALVLVFEESTRLAGAYGLAVCGTMAITSLIYFVVITRSWKWPLWKAVPLLLLFLTFDLTFLAANATKFIHGGYVPVAIAVVLTIMMTIWYRGRKLLGWYYAARTKPADAFIAEVEATKLLRPKGAAVFMSSNPDGMPPLLAHHVARGRALFETVVLLSVIYEHRPSVPSSERATVQRKAGGFVRVVLRFGFMDNINVPRALARVSEVEKLGLDVTDVTYYLGRETFLATGAGRMGRLTETAFAFISRNSRSATAYFQLPPEQVVEIGMQIDL